MTVATAAGPPTARALRRRLRRVRSLHRDTSLAGILTELYVVAMAVAIYGAMAVTAIRRHLRLPPPASPADAWVRAGLLIAGVLVIGGIAWHAARSLGPLYLTAAGRYWAAGTPVDRAGWLRPALGWVVLTGAGCGALLGGFAALFGDIDPGLATALILTTAAAGGASITAGAVVAQVRATSLACTRRAAGSVPTKIMVSCGLTVATGVVALHALDVRLSLPAVSVPWVAGTAVLVATGAAATALRRLGRLDAAALSGGAQLADAATLAVVLLQPAMFSDIVEIRRWRRVGRVRSRPFGPPPSILAGRQRTRRMWTLVRADLRRQWRRPAGLVACAGLLVVPYAAALVAPGATTPVRVVAAYLATERLCAGLRTVCRSPALRRTIGGSDRLVRWSHLVVPGAALSLWWAATGPAVGGRGWVEPALALGVLFAAYRSATRRPTRYDGPAIDTPFGLIQPDLFTQLARGLDILAVVALAAFMLR